jgi:hypothetical protein
VTITRAAAEAAPAPAPEALIRFGPGAGQFVSVALAAAILNTAWQKNPAAFGLLVRESMIRLWAEMTEDNPPAAVNGHQDGGQ